MVSELIQFIFDKTKEEVFANISSDISLKEAYLRYLFNKYEEILKGFCDGENKDLLSDILDLYINEEIDNFRNLSQNEILSLLSEDSAFEHLTFLSEITFAQAKNVKSTGVHIDNEQEYIERMEELAKCLEGIKPYNIIMAKELLAESVLEIEYIYGKSSVMSMRLSRAI